MYWETLLKEVLSNKPKTRLGRSQLSAGTQGSGTKIRKESKKIYLGKNLVDIYFTSREAEVMVELLRGQTLQEAASTLKLSPRTIEFYVKNMKTKLKCRTKSELIAKIWLSDFAKNVGFIENLGADMA